jgi:two-component system sensor histidine kinase MtrB
MASELLYASSESFDPASARAVELLQQQSERFENLLNDLLEISRLDAGAVKLEIDDVDVNAMVTRVTESLDSIAQVQQVKVEKIFQDSVGSVPCDVRRVERIVRNLISNAIEHAQGKEVKVIVAGDDTAVAIVVRDFGSGLQPGEAALVFNRFWRADPSRQRTIGGTGLGLSISLEDARIHGGWLEADGEPGKGASFRLVLPRQENAEIVSAPLPLALDEIDLWLKENA